jgi:nucleoside-diphosphate-sugar epimerase
VAGTYPQHIALGRQGTVESCVMAEPTILITGSIDFLGQAIAQALICRYAVIGLDMVQPKQPIHGMATIQTGLTSDASVARAMQAVRERAGDRITSVIHLAAYYDTTGEDNPKYGAVAVKGTLGLLEALKALRTDQFIFSSTLLVHAPRPEKGVKIDEDSPLDPAWAYPKSKLQTERLVTMHRGSIKTVITRFTGIYDEDCRASFIAQ